MSGPSGEILRPEIRDVPIDDLYKNLGRLAAGSNLFVVGRNTQLFPHAGTLVLGEESNFNNVVTVVASFINPDPEIPVSISGTNIGQVDEIRRILSRSNHESLVLSDVVDEKDGSKLGMKELLELGGFFIIATEEEGEDAIVRFVLSNEFLDPDSNPEIAQDLLPIYDIKGYLENELGFSKNTTKRALGHLRKVGARHQTYPSLGLSRFKLIEAFNSGEFNNIPGFNEKDLSIILSIVRHITKK